MVARVSHPRAGESYRAPDYWDALHRSAEDLGAVGYPTLPPVFNRHVYANAARAVLRGLDAAGAGVRGRTVLDVGSGTGFWAEIWLQEGAASVAGADLASSAVERLRARFPDSAFAQVDITEHAPFPGSQFDVVTAMSVLLHVVDEERFRSALANLAAQMAPDGHLVVLDPLVVRGRWMPPDAESAHNVVRTLAQWEDAAVAAGLHVGTVIPTAALLSDPVDAGSRAAFTAHRLWWRALTAALRGRDRLAAVVVPPLAALDRAVVARLHSGPSAKLIVLERLCDR
jgi:2-polyprenyl-3-methyl-5-hydroxy-6-metoxy-1,4-benzoquinol methylase